MPRTYVLVIAAVLVAPTACRQPDPSSVHYRYHPPESQKFLDCYDKISDDMGEEEVNAILAGYPQEREEEKREADSRGRRLKRPGSFHVSFDEKPGARERDFFIIVHFDEAHRVVGKSWGEYSK